ncbi:MAG: YdjY domain-containing protein [Deferrisomatales bacterium]
MDSLHFPVEGRTRPGERAELRRNFDDVARGGIKDYESLLSLDTDGKTFNLACILIGLEPAKGGLTARPLDRSLPWEGERVRLWVSWQQDGQERRLPAAALLRLQAAEPAPDDWVYGGSAFSDDGRYLADVTGTLIGFVHDPVSVIEHRVGLGVGRYGAVGGDPAQCPPVGSRVHLTVERHRTDGPAPRPVAPQPR